MKTTNTKPSTKVSDKTKAKIELAKEITFKQAQKRLLEAELIYLEGKYNTFDQLYKDQSGMGGISTTINIRHQPVCRIRINQ